MKEQALKQLNEVLKENFSTINEVEKALSERFQDLYATYEEAQVAYDELNREINGLLGEYFVYSISGEDGAWYVGTGDAFKEEDLPTYMENFNEHYNQTFHTQDDLTSKLEHQVMKTMDNAGCDPFSAISMILEEDLGLENVFAILGGEGEPRIEWANFDQI